MSPSHDERLLVHHLFSTIQGEGPFSGERAVFIRLSGCNLACPLCDTDYSSKADLLTTREVFARVQAHAPTYTDRLVVITGGEPFRQQIGPLVRTLLLDGGYRVQIETNGSLFQPLMWCSELTVVCSPKTSKVHPNLERHVNAYKYVLHADDIRNEDGLPTRCLAHPASPYVARPHERFRGKVYVHPADVGDPVDNRRHLNAAVASCLRFGYTLGIQLHKLINVE